MTVYPPAGGIRPAMVVIDMQNGFLDPASPLCIRMARETVPACAAALEEARRRKIPVIYACRQYRADGSDVEHTRYRRWAEAPALTPGSTGPLSEEIPASIAPRPGDYQLVKPRFSAFFHTELDLLLRRLQVNTVVLLGTTTPNCIRTSCYDAISLEYNVAILTDCCSSNTPEIQRANLTDMANIGAVLLDSETFIREGLSLPDTSREASEAALSSDQLPGEDIFPAAEEETL